MTRYFLIGTVAAAVSLFVWQSISNTVIPWHSAPMHAMTPAAVQALHGALPENGLYAANEGILAVVATTPDMRDKTRAMGIPLARQVVVDLAAALFLALAVARLAGRGAWAARGPFATALTLALAAAGLATILAISNWNWYGYPLAFELSNVGDITVQGFIAGLVLGWALERFAPEAAADRRYSMAGA